jgi:hypothetical protein
MNSRMGGKRVPSADKSSKFTVLWKCLNHFGHEWCQLQQDEARIQLHGVALFRYDRKPCRLEYSIECDLRWRTQTAEITGTIGARDVSIQLEVDPARHWKANGKRIHSVDGCIDVDLGFSPSTNMLPINRISLHPGDRTMVTAAWIEFPTMKIKPLNQIYERIDKSRYRYLSQGGKFRKTLIVNKRGIVLTYPGYWHVEVANEK